MKVFTTDIAGVFVAERASYGDTRGCLTRLFCADALRAADWVKPVVQVNHTFTAAAGTVRGLHFQRPPYAEMKLVSCLQGEVWDVAVDLRCSSPTFLRWHAERLSADNRRALLIPEGCAHGFQTLVDDCVLVYCHSAPYTPAAEGGVRHDDPALAIAWPLPVCQLSQRDLAHPLIHEGFTGVDIG